MKIWLWGLVVVAVGCRYATPREAVAMGRNGTPVWIEKLRVNCDRLAADCLFDFSKALNQFSKMKYAALDGSGEWSQILEDKEESGESSKWHEAGDSAYNEKGERIPLSAYARLCNSESLKKASVVRLKDRRRTACDFQTTLSLCVENPDALDPDYWDFHSIYVDGHWIKGDAETCRLFAWNLGGGLYEVFNEERRGTLGLWTLTYLFFDGTTKRNIIDFSFDPDSKRIQESIRLVRSNYAALNNIAAMIFNDLAWRQGTSRDYVRDLLLIAARAGVPVACYNLAVYYSDGSYGEKNSALCAFWLQQATKRAAVANRVNMDMKRPIPLSDYPLKFP